MDNYLHSKTILLFTQRSRLTLVSAGLASSAAVPRTGGVGGTLVGSGARPRGQLAGTCVLAGE